MKIASLFLATSLLASSAFAAETFDAAKAQVTLKEYAATVHVVYSDAKVSAIKLQTAVDAFLAKPSAETQLAAQKAWLESREIWAQTEAYRFYEGPIDDATYGVEGLINPWPLDEAYIDSVVGNEDAGIINNAAAFPVINEEVLIGLNEKGAETNIATGFHAIEFLLWGQDLSLVGPGARPFTDYTTAKNAERRATYLKVVTDLLIKHIGVVQAAWDPTDLQGFGANFSKQGDNVALAKVFKGMVSLLVDELAGERMYVGYESQSQEDEHSCFSDNTHRDIIQDIQGVINVWSGNYGSVKGVGVSQLVAPAVAKRVSKQLDAALAAALALPTPYDSLLVAAEDSEERKQLLDAIFSIQDAGTELRQAAESIGISIPVE